MSELVNTLQLLSETADKFGPLILSLTVMILIICGLMILMYLGIKYVNKVNTAQIQLQEAILKSQSNTKEIDENRYILSKEKSKNLIDTYLRMNSGLKFNCRDSLHTVHGDRMAIYLFHNGQHSTKGVSFLKTSCICEYTSKNVGAYQLMNTHRNLPINILGDLLEDLTHKEQFVVFRKDLNKVDAFISRVLLSEEEKTSIFVSIYDRTEDINELIGFIVCEFNNVDECTDEELENNFKVLRGLAERSAIVLQIAQVIGPEI